MVGTGIYVIGERTFYSSVKRDAEHPPPPAFTTLVERCTFALYPLFHDTLHSCFCTDLLICKNEKGQPNDFLILGDPRLTVRQKGWKKGFSAASGVMIRGKRAGRDGSLDRLRWSLPWEMGPGKGCIWGAESDIKLLCSEANANFFLFLLIKTSFRLHSYQCLSVLEY